MVGQIIDVAAKGTKIVANFGAGIAITAVACKAKKVVKVITNSHIDKEVVLIKKVLFRKK